MVAKLFSALLLLAVGFVVGMLAQYSTNRHLERDIVNARQELATHQASSQLWQVRDAAALLVLEVERKNYGTAADSSTQFFNQVRELASQTSDTNLKSSLLEVLNSRDRITAGIAKQDPAVVPEIQSLVTKIHEGAKR